MDKNDCVFCKIVSGEIEAQRVYEDEHTVVFLDNGPLFPGHCLVCPREHFETMLDIPQERLAPLFGAAQLIAQAVEQGLGAEGSFVAVNNRISQSVPHLHVHVVPRRRKDGLKGFFWPRRSYKDKDEMAETVTKLQNAIEVIRRRQGGAV